MSADADEGTHSYSSVLVKAAPRRCRLGLATLRSSSPTQDRADLRGLGDAHRTPGRRAHHLPRHRQAPRTGSRVALGDHLEAPRAVRHDLRTRGPRVVRRRLREAHQATRHPTGRRRVLTRRLQLVLQKEAVAGVLNQLGASEDGTRLSTTPPCRRTSSLPTSRSSGAGPRSCTTSTTTLSNFWGPDKGSTHLEYKATLRTHANNGEFFKNLWRRRR